MAKKRGRSIKLGSILGIEIELHYTWFIILALLVWGLSTGFFPVYYPELSATAVWVLGAIAAVLLFVSVLLHELMHSIVAKASRMRVDKITLFFFGGIAQIPGGGLTPKKEFKMAIAGPLFSLFLGFVFLLVYLYVPSLYIQAISKYLYTINFILAAFNMIPGFPLDGGRVFRSILWYFYKDIKKATRIAAYGGKVFAIILIIMGFLNFIGIVIFIYGGLWFIIIGFFLYYIAGASYEQIILKELLSKVSVKDIMLKKPVAVKADITVADLFSKFLKLRQESFLVMDGKKLAGIVSVKNMKKIPKEEWKKTKVSEIMINKFRTITPDENAFDAMMKMLESGTDIIPVKKDGKIAGILAREDIIHYIRIKASV